MSFHYEPIRSNLKEIRLVQISSADEFESEVVCDLKQAKIDDALPYEALSYAWGSPRLTETINLNGCSFKITPHLKTILCYLRRKDTVRTLWIDAICINQADVDERAEQVSIMRDIYRHCERDVLWLGDDPGKKGAMRRLRSDLPMHRWMLDFRELYYSEVWDRVWIMQELINAPRILLLCGNHEIEWEILDQKALDHYTGNDNFVNLGPNMVAILEYRASTGKSDGWSLVDVLERFRYCKATDPRDLLFGILGLAHGNHGVVVDYTRPVKNVFMDLALRIMHHSKDLETALSQCWLPQKLAELGVLPSWASNRLTPDSSTLRLRLVRNLYQAGKIEFEPPRTISQSGEICLNGRLLGRPKLACRAGLKSIHMDGERFYRCLRRFYQNASSEALENYPITGESFDRAFWRTVLFDARDKSGRLQESDLVLIDKLSLEFRKAEKPEDDFEFSEEYRGLLKDLLLIRKSSFHFTSTDTDLFAIVDYFTGDHDIIVVLDGSRVPMVLREATSSSSGISVGKADYLTNTALPKISYKIVGLCYVHGFMDGEAYWPKRGLKEETFLIS